MTMAPGDLTLTERLHAVAALAEHVTRNPTPIFGSGHDLDMQRIKVALARACEALLIAERAISTRDPLVLDGALLNLKVEAQTALALASAYQRDVREHRTREPGKARV